MVTDSAQHSTNPDRPGIILDLYGVATIGVIVPGQLVDTLPDTTIIKVDVIRKLPVP